MYNNKVAFSKNTMGDIRFKLIIVGGGSASGKTKFCEDLKKEVGNRATVFKLSADCAYKTPPPEFFTGELEYDFDHPAAFDWSLLHATITQIRSDVEKAHLGDTLRIALPQYDFTTHKRLEEFQIVEVTLNTPIFALCFEGILALHDERIRKMAETKVFVDVNSITRLIRRQIRDILFRGRDLFGILVQILQDVEPAYVKYVAPTRKLADVTVHNDITLEELEKLKSRVGDNFDLMNITPKKANSRPALSISETGFVDGCGEPFKRSLLIIAKCIYA